MGRVNFLISAHIYVSVDNCAEIYSVNDALQNQATLDNIFCFYSQLYSQHVIISSVGNKSWVKEHTNGY